MFVSSVAPCPNPTIVCTSGVALSISAGTVLGVIALNSSHNVIREAVQVRRLSVLPVLTNVLVFSFWKRKNLWAKQSSSWRHALESWSVPRRCFRRQAASRQACGKIFRSCRSSSWSWRHAGMDAFSWRVCFPVFVQIYFLGGGGVFIYATNWLIAASMAGWM